MFTYKNILFFLLSAVYSVNVFSEEFEFDERFGNQLVGQKIIDFERFKFGNPIPSGDYIADIYVNNKIKGQTSIKFIEQENDNDPILGLCLTQNVIDLLDLKDKAFEYDNSNQNCVSAVKSIPSASIKFDIASQSLHITLPQENVISRPKGYISPSLWQSGVPTAFVRYDANYNKYENQKNFSLNIFSGINFFDWSIRHRGYKQWSDNKKYKYNSSYLYAQHEIVPIKSQLTLGDFYVNGHSIQNMRIKGVRIASDNRMLPVSLRGYAPVVRGIANSQSKITIKQNEQIVYEIDVPAGAFVIDDLYPSGNGDLLVEIQDASGNIRSFIVPFSNSIYLVREGQFNYQLSVGKYHSNNKTFDDLIYQGELQYGILNGLNLNLGTTYSKNYLSNAIGFSLDTHLGYILTKFSFDKVKLIHENKTLSNKKLDISYGVYIPKINTNIYLSGFNSFSKNNYSLENVLSLNSLDEKNHYFSSHDGQLRNSYAITINNHLKDDFGSFSFSARKNIYWNNITEKEYYLSYGNNFKSFQYELGYSQSINDFNNKKDNVLFANFSLPLGSDISAPILNSYYTHSDINTFNSSINGVFGEDNQFNYGASLHKNNNRESNYSSYLGYKNSIASFNISASKSGHSKRYSSRVSGAIVAHPNGITLSNNISDTFGIITAKGASGAKINNTNNYLDYWGNGIVPYLSPYQINYISLNPNSLPDNIALSSTGKKVIPKANSALLINFDVESSDYTLFEIKQPEDNKLPIASEAFDESGKLVGYVMQGSRLFAQLSSVSGKIKVIWGNNMNQQCEFYYDLSKNKNTQDNGKKYSVNCLGEK